MAATIGAYIVSYNVNRKKLQTIEYIIHEFDIIFSECWWHHLSGAVPNRWVKGKSSVWK